ncbi:MAG: coproporphyrinogen dehydrogenase HemZ [Ruminococcaceae bacterium]|nr:coproporphyrinogen dehydrogenase HemZ [Oscillospiraceae bacterium]
MKLIINGNISPYYVQTLCLIFFPGSKFSESEEVTDEVPVVTVNLEETEDALSAVAQIKLGDTFAVGKCSELKRKKRTYVDLSKVVVGKALFEAGTNFFAYTPSWGILTGIRPSKIARKIYDEGYDGAQIRKILRNEYLLSNKKAALLTSITLNEAKIIEELSKDSCSLYISIPFCPTRCAYCSFISFATKRLLSMIPEYLERLLLDLDGVFEIIKERGLKLSTIYIGGGTPTTLSAAQLDTLLSKIEENVDVTMLEEYTLEAGRPDTIDPEKIRVIKEHGVTRISINPQTLNDTVLDGIGRRHTAADFFRAFEMAREGGIQQINTDLIAGLPSEGYRSFSKSVDEVLALRPENFTVHTFCVKKAADVAKQGGDVYSAPGGDVLKSVDYSQLRAKSSGYIPYYLYKQKNTVGNLENVGFALPGCEGKYNIYIMEELQTIFAVGAGSVTKMVDREHNMIERYFMPKYPYEYLAKDNSETIRKEYFSKIRDFYSRLDALRANGENGENN